MAHHADPIAPPLQHVILSLSAYLLGFFLGQSMVQLGERPAQIVRQSRGLRRGSEGLLAALASDLRTADGNAYLQA